MLRQLFIIASLWLGAYGDNNCNSDCVCTYSNNGIQCIAQITGIHRHDCKGYCHDRACGGVDNNRQSCRLWNNGYCDDNGGAYTRGRGGYYVGYCNERAEYNSCNHDCPGHASPAELFALPGPAA
ncbi:uncharacterized protein MYCGRDRAFT_95211 [Zymoseptoria tritici IPO323]|uniref:Uncharacterized protein n=1 Tax=Zymoseptoria tritici (strain CBS 115943 / IPO323) TaxID=336722 RepID=F9XHY6_ZYMTI|nr:uncharacterized protein MYCGRDRAFT_95211 [Zymoseptoria tritici IPO323]EGP85034.1 hypothetical protein MYCGRDRAFT_95211 [Zymoseptoria tritici IPO323]